ncbi:MAG: hypothetical protein IJU30_09195 [Lachnospiraceae bacterium]|nr:hypothetical protein [Lachnospiraceae bacterium]
MKNRALSMIGAAILSGIVLVTGCGNSAQTQTTAAETTAADTAAESAVGMANPWADYGTITEAEEAAGFKFELPDALEGCKASSYRAMKDGMIEVIFTDESGEEAYRLRKGKGSKLDISGDFNEYAYDDELELITDNATTIVNLRSNDDGVHNMIFSSEECSYSFTAGKLIPDDIKAQELALQIINNNEDFGTLEV